MYIYIHIIYAIYTYTYYRAMIYGNFHHPNVQFHCEVMTSAEGPEGQQVNVGDESYPLVRQAAVRMGRGYHGKMMGTPWEHHGKMGKTMEKWRFNPLVN